MTGVPVACGKLTLCGEHFVLHGAPALALPWNGGELSLRRGGDSSARTDPSRDSRLLQAWNIARGLAGLAPVPACPFRVDSTIPPGAGLGSSAALSVALVDAAWREAGATPSDVDRIAAATGVEGVFHGRSSGIDPAAVVLRRPVLREAGGALTPLSWRLPCGEVALAIAVGERRTAEAVERTRAFAAARPVRFGELLQEASGLVREVAGLLAAGTDPGGLERLGVLLTRNHAMLRELGVSTGALDRLADGALEAGALGAKLCGAGLGGVVLAIPRPGAIVALTDALERAGAERVMTWRVGEPWRSGA